MLTVDKTQFLDQQKYLGVVHVRVGLRVRVRVRVRLRVGLRVEKKVLKVTK